MKSYVNGFIYGRDLLKKVIMATVICCVLSIVFRQNMTSSLVRSSVMTSVASVNDSARGNRGQKQAD